MASKQTFISGVAKLQHDICVVDTAPLTKDIIDLHNNNITAFFVNATEVLNFNRSDVVSWVKVPMIGKIFTIIW